LLGRPRVDQASIYFSRPLDVVRSTWGYKAYQRARQHRAFRISGSRFPSWFPRWRRWRLPPDHSDGAVWV